jgi:hypothetical protein
MPDARKPARDLPVVASKQDAAHWHDGQTSVPIPKFEPYLKQFDGGISRSPLDAEDRLFACQEDRQGLRLSRKHPIAASNELRPG